MSNVDKSPQGLHPTTPAGSNTGISSTRVDTYAEETGQLDLNPDLNPSSPPPHRTSRTNTDFPHSGRLRRRNTRVGPIQIIENFEEFDTQPGWQPGSEPGVDTSRPDGGHSSMAKLCAQCQVTIVDFSQDNIVIHELDNDGLIEFLKIPQPSWVKCRWVNVNGLSWDVIQALGQYKQLHVDQLSLGIRPTRSLSSHCKSLSTLSTQRMSWMIQSAIGVQQRSLEG